MSSDDGDEAWQWLSPNQRWQFARQDSDGTWDAHWKQVHPGRKREPVSCRSHSGVAAVPRQHQRTQVDGPRPLLHIVVRLRGRRPPTCPRDPGWVHRGRSKVQLGCAASRIIFLVHTKTVAVENNATQSN